MKATLSQNKAEACSTSNTYGQRPSIIGYRVRALMQKQAVLEQKLKKHRSVRLKFRLDSNYMTRCNS